MNQADEQGYEALTRGDSLADQVYRQLSRAVLGGSFSPGERITIRRLADQLGVSATPAREAVLRLVSDDVLQVTERSAIIVPERGGEEISEIFDIRRGLEGKLAACAATHLDESDIGFLEATQAAFLEAIAAEDYKEVLRCNALFHFRIYGRAAPPLHLRIVESLWLRIGPTLQHMYPTLRIDRKRQGRHEDIIDCARTRDPLRLRTAILADLDTSEQALHLHRAQATAPQRRRAPR